MKQPDRKLADQILADQIANLGYPVGMGVAPRPDAVAAMRAAIIEECARVAEAYLEDDYTPPVMIDKIAAAIRALKDKLCP